MVYYQLHKKVGTFSTSTQNIGDIPAVNKQVKKIKIICHKILRY